MSEQLLQEKRKQIQQKLDKMMDDFCKTKWKDLELSGKKLSPIPNWFIEDFKKIVMKVPSMSCPYHMSILAPIFKKKNIDLFFAEVGIAINFFNHVAPECYSKDLEEYEKKRAILDILTIVQNERMEQANEEGKITGQNMAALINPQNGKLLSTSRFHA